MAAELTCVVVALGREAMYFRRWLTRPRAVPAAPCPVWTATGPAGDILLVRSGMGGEAARRALAWVLPRLAPARVLSAGFCGALADELPVGAVVLPDEVVTEDGRDVPGLYAAGRNACGIPRSSWGYCSGTSVADATFFGRLAGRSAAANRSW